MKYLKLFPATLFILLLTQAAFPQSKFSGKVVDVLDGKTVVIQTVGGKMTAALQYIEVPEPEQPLYRTVAEHLRKLVINKRVEFRAQRVSTEVIVGQLVMDGTDVSQQMLRDGAAWHMGRDKTGQGVVEWTAYAENQSQARAEKLGVWSVPGLKPAWEFRAEKEEALRQKALAEKPPPVVVEINPVDQTKTPMRRWKPEEVLKATAGYNPWPDINKDQPGPLDRYRHPIRPGPEIRHHRNPGRISAICRARRARSGSRPARCMFISAARIALLSAGTGSGSRPRRRMVFFRNRRISCCSPTAKSSTSKR